MDLGHLIFAFSQFFLYSLLIISAQHSLISSLGSNFAYGN